jgi:hypothetical protein
MQARACIYSHRMTDDTGLCSGEGRLEGSGCIGELLKAEPDTSISTLLDASFISLLFRICHPETLSPG